jgi:hypothetical protein
MTGKFNLAVIAAVLTVALGGCSGFPENSQWTEAKVVESSWLKPRALAVTPSYCYRTIGTPVCYGWPKEHQETRLVGFSGPAPY